MYHACLCLLALSQTLTWQPSNSETNLLSSPCYFSTFLAIVLQCDNGRGDRLFGSWLSMQQPLPGDGWMRDRYRGNVYILHRQYIGTRIFLTTRALVCVLSKSRWKARQERHQALWLHQVVAFRPWASLPGTLHWSSLVPGEFLALCFSPAIAWLWLKGLVRTAPCVSVCHNAFLILTILNF